ncbi:nitrate/nitrite two-component system sensor histidine kinase NarQ [Alginatibacterium sediminis]|uniref:Sensor protein n=1 Tax=Alginatibacterium sediminis TaxID=2164068 RepID=A0A420EHN2_9ALTE|nr:nitrate/nitrite two-component system sensor histidine kinase NarQ [Alginatibacterium sediminis]
MFSPSLVQTTRRIFVASLGLFAVIALSSMISLATSLKDAEAVNVAGSLRMQSYRLAYGISSGQPNLNDKIAAFEQSLHAPSLSRYSNDWIYKDQAGDYFALQQHWARLKPFLLSDNPQLFLDEVVTFVSEIDKFVEGLQYLSENKILTLVGVQLFAFVIMALLFASLQNYLKRYLVEPLQGLASMAKRIEAGQFNVESPTTSCLEIHKLSDTMSTMTKQLESMYSTLEQQVSDKTNQLQTTNRELSSLYAVQGILQQLELSDLHLLHSLDILIEQLDISGACLQLNARKQTLLRGQDQTWNWVGLSFNQLEFGQLGLPQHVDGYAPLIQAYGLAISRALHFERHIVQQQKLLILDERATIARELHDSLAQSLSYMKIQISLLKRELDNNPVNDKTQSYIDELQMVISQSYLQLRQLLTTFRLSVKEALLSESLKAIVKQLDEQSQHRIQLYSQLSNDNLPADLQIHVIQLVREATINAIKHAQCDNIQINCSQNKREITIRVEDNGASDANLIAKADHFGLQIMRERSERLNGQLLFTQSHLGGLCVELKFSV